MTKRLLLAVLTFGIICLKVSADSPATPGAYVATSSWGTYYFVMIPGWKQFSESPVGRMSMHPMGIAYKVLKDGSIEEIWRTEGWYSFQVFLSLDGNYLVAMGPWNPGSGPSKEDVAVQFYARGKLLRQYSTADMVKDPTKVQRSVSHYFWMARDIHRGSERNKDDEPELSWDNTFRLKTCDGITYRFDATTGAIKEQIH